MVKSSKHMVKNRPPPTSQGPLELGFLGSVLNVELPDNIDQQQLTETKSFKEKFDPSVHVGKSGSSK